MPIVPEDWNVVVLGYWNRAILTPAGIARRLFLLDEGTPVQVMVPLDALAPYQVRHENQTVIAGSDRLVVQPVRNDVESLVGSMEIARRALEGLPHTPVSAAGFNLKYRSPGVVEILQQITGHEWDNRISDEHYEIESRTISRVVRWRNGTIKIFISQERENTYTVLLNFERQSDNEGQLRDWLQVTADDIRAQAERILQNTIGLTPEDIANA